MVLQRRNDAPRRRRPSQHLIPSQPQQRQRLHMDGTGSSDPHQRTKNLLLPFPQRHKRPIRIHVRGSLLMRQRPIELQSLSQPMDVRRGANVAESEDASPESPNAVSASRSAIMLRNERKRLRYEMVYRWLGRHEGVGTADGGAGYDSRLANKRD